MHGKRPLGMDGVCDPLARPLAVFSCQRGWIRRFKRLLGDSAKLAGRAVTVESGDVVGRNVGSELHLWAHLYGELAMSWHGNEVDGLPSGMSRFQ